MKPEQIAKHLDRKLIDAADSWPADVLHFGTRAANSLKQIQQPAYRLSHACRSMVKGDLRAFVEACERGGIA